MNLGKEHERTGYPILYTSADSVLQIAVNVEVIVFKIVSFAWAGFGATFGPTVLFALFWKRSNRNGALADIISGGIITWYYFPTSPS